jgi:hypothetical protein
LQEGARRRQALEVLHGNVTPKHNSQVDYGTARLLNDSQPPMYLPVCWEDTRPPVE